jgi:hypothetical protein
VFDSNERLEASQGAVVDQERGVHYGADLSGNFFLRHCDGSVRYWDHQAQADTAIAPSVRDFLGKLVETP